MTGWLFLVHDRGIYVDEDSANIRAGRQIVELQTSLGLLTAADTNSYTSRSEDVYGRQAFHHPATENVEVLNAGGKQFFLHHRQMSGIAARYGLPEVVRWQPKDVRAHSLPSTCANE